MDSKDPEFFKKSCKYSSQLCLLIQHFSNAISFEKALRKPEFVHDMLYVLYQVYLPLAFLRNNFTHYDLHWNNVILYEPQPNSYIEYHYHMTDGTTTSFKSKYLVKIIDYGRCFFQNLRIEKMNSRVIYEKICQAETECGGTMAEKNCGRGYGYQLLNEEYYPGFLHYISSQKPNQSHDLRLLRIIQVTFAKKHDQYFLYNKDLGNIIRSVYYETDMGTSIRESVSSKYIVNVVYAFFHLNRVIRIEQNKKINDARHSGMKKLGNLHIYANGSKPLLFEETL